MTSFILALTSLKATPRLLQMLHVRSASTSLLSIDAIDVQIVMILRDILIYQLIPVMMAKEDSNWTDHDKERMASIQKECWKLWDETDVVLTIILRYKCSLLGIAKHQKQDKKEGADVEEKKFSREFRSVLISILQCIIGLHRCYCDSLISTRKLISSSSSIIEFMELAPTDPDIYHLALRWCTELLKDPAPSSNLSTPIRAAASPRSQQPTSGESPTAWKDLLRNCDLPTCASFSNLILFGLKHSGAEVGSSINDPSVALHIQHDLFETIALALEAVGGKWAILVPVSDSAPCIPAARAGSTLLACIRMASGELRILLDRVLNIGRANFGKVENQMEQQQHKIMANTILHCTRIILTAMHELVAVASALDVEENEPYIDDTADWADLDMGTVLHIKESMDDALDAVFQFLASPAFDKECDGSKMNGEPLLDSVALLCSRCIETWLAENDIDSIPSPTQSIILRAMQNANKVCNRHEWANRDDATV